MKIVIDKAIPYIRGVFEPFGAEVAYLDIITREDAARADALIVRTRTRCDEALLGGSRVAIVASATVGTDHIDTDYCRRAGIEVANAPGSNARAVLQWVAAALAATIPAADEGIAPFGRTGRGLHTGKGGWPVWSELDLYAGEAERPFLYERDSCAGEGGRFFLGGHNSHTGNGERPVMGERDSCAGEGGRFFLGGHNSHTGNGERPVLGVVGVGHVGSLVAEYAREWGFEVLCCDPPRARMEKCDDITAGTSVIQSGLDAVRRPADRTVEKGVFKEATLDAERRPANDGIERFIPLDELASRADIVTFHTPLTRDGADPTYHLADDTFFSKLKPGAVVLNSSRGEVVDTDALLRAGCACCIDTWEDEPHIDRRLLAHALLATPHIAGYSVQGKANATAAVVRAVARRLGLPLAEWYPPEVAPATPRPISWEELLKTITNYFDIRSESLALKSAPEKFEPMRNDYRYREEYF